MGEWWCAEITKINAFKNGTELFEREAEHVRESDVNCEDEIAAIANLKSGPLPRSLPS